MTQDGECHFVPDADGVLICELHSSENMRILIALGAKEPCVRALIRHNRQVARDPSCSVATMHRLRQHPAPGVREVLATRSDLPEGIATALGADDADRVRRALARNPATPTSVLERMADRGVKERRWLAQNQGLSERLVQRLVHDPSEAVRKKMADNVSISEQFLEQLAVHDPSSVVRHVAIHNEALSEATLDALSRRTQPWIRAIASRRSTSGDMLERLSSDPCALVRAAVVLNPRVTAAILDALAGDTNDEVRISVAMNLLTPDELLERLSADWSDDVRWAVAQHPFTSRPVLERLEHDSDPRTAEDARFSLRARLGMLFY